MFPFSAANDDAYNVKAPASMHDMYLYQRNIAGVPQTVSKTGNNTATATGSAGGSGQVEMGVEVGSVAEVTKDTLAMNNVSLIACFLDLIMCFTFIFINLRVV